MEQWSLESRTIRWVLARDEAASDFSICNNDDDDYDDDKDDDECLLKIKGGRRFIIYKENI